MTEKQSIPPTNPGQQPDNADTDTSGFRRQSFQPTEPVYIQHANGYSVGSAETRTGSVEAMETERRDSEPTPVGVFDESLPIVSEEVVREHVAYEDLTRDEHIITDTVSASSAAIEQRASDTDEFLNKDYTAAAADTAKKSKGKVIGGVALGFALVGLALSWNILGSIIALVLLVIALILVISAMKKPGGVALRVIALILVFVGILISLMTLAATWAALAGGLSVKPTSSVVEVGGTPVELSLPGVEVPAKGTVDLADPAPITFTY